MHRPPSTSNATPVIMLASSEHKKHAAFPISSGVENRPNGIVDKNLARTSGVSSPMKDFSSGVSPATGFIALTRIPCVANSIAMVFVAVIIHPLDALYQFKLGRGETPAVDATFRMTPRAFDLK